MIKPVLKTMSFAFVVVFASAAMSRASDQNPSGPLADLSIGDEHLACSARADVDRGWEQQQELLEARLAARGADGILVPGAIISPPFPEFPAYRVDVPSSTLARRGSKSAKTARATKEAGR